MMRRKKAFFPGLLIILFGLLSSLPISAQVTCAISVNQAQVINPKSKKLLGASFDGRSSMDFDPGPGIDPAGYYDPITGALLAAVDTAWSRMPLRGVRYPGNLEILNWNWSYTIGPFADRISQPMGPNGTNSQTIKFGFDEFMAMTAWKGLPSNEVQIMVNLYASVGQPNPATLAADWVEYCNTPNNGSNPRGGINWAMLRDSFGHPAPYGIKIWNIGNEPWQPGELGNDTIGANAFIALAIPIIDSMLAVDSSLHITVPAVGKSTSPWNSTLLASTNLMSRIYGFSSHAFYDEEPTTPNPTVNQTQVLIAELAPAVGALGKKVIAGDQAHFAPANDPDKAMRWQGALATADYLIMLSQIGNIELANFWIYGNVKAVWHPIRKNANGSYTFMAAAQLYEAFDSVFYEQSLNTVISNASGGGPVPAVRATAFKSNNGAKASILAINIDLAIDREVVPPTLTGFVLQQVRQLTASSINNDTFMTTVVFPLGNGNYALPHASILIFDYQSAPLAVEFVEPLRAYLVDAGVRVEWATATQVNSSHFEVERSAEGIDFEKIGRVEALSDGATFHQYAALDRYPFPGLNYYRIKEVAFGGSYQYSKILSVYSRSFEITLFPNPVAGQLHIRLQPESGDAAVFRLLNPSGQLVLEEKLSRVTEATFQVAHLPNGLYFYRFWSGKEWFGGRLIKL